LEVMGCEGGGGAAGGNALLFADIFLDSEHSSDSGRVWCLGEELCSVAPRFRCDVPFIVDWLGGRDMSLYQ